VQAEGGAGSQGKANARASGPHGEWLYPSMATLVVLAALMVYERAGTPESSAAATSAPGAAVAARGEPVAELEALASPPPEAGLPAVPRTTVGGGWYAVPPKLTGNLVRVEGLVLQVQGSKSGPSPMACLSEPTPLTTPIRVGSRASKGARVAVRLLDADGRLLPAGDVPGGSQLFLAQGRGALEWTAFEQRLAPVAGVSFARLCVDNRAGSGVVRVRNVRFTPE
jgi:hypothetical protein